MKLIDHAKAYIAAGISIVPIGMNKLPNWDVLPRSEDGKPTWKPFQERRATDDELSIWFASAKTTGMAAVCGNISGGLRCFDFDEASFFTRWGQAIGGRGELSGALVQKTHRGYQVLVRTIIPGHNQVFACVPDQDRKEGYRPVIETRGEGGYCLLPPSLHPKGHVYQWMTGFGDVQNIKLILPDQLLRWDTEAEKLNEVSGSITGGSAHEKKPRPLTLVTTVIDLFNRSRNIREYLERWGYVEMRGGFHRPDGRKQSVYIHQMDESEGGAEVTWHWNSGDVLCGFNMHGKLHDSFDWFRITEHGGDWAKALHAASREVGIELDPQEEAPDDSYQLIEGSGNAVICTDDPELGTLLGDEGANVLIGPSHSWPRSWLRAIEKFPHRFVLFREANEDAELTAAELDARVVDMPEALDIFKMVGKVDFAKMMVGASRDPSY